MKKYLIPAMLMATVSLMTACGNSQESSTEVAKDQNEQKADSNAMANDSQTMGTTSSMSDSSSMSKDQDMDFAVEAASGGLMEVELGKLAATNAASASVKAFGKQMVTDHTKANEELKKLAAAKNITLPITPGTKHQDHINDLKGKTGAEFDKAYMDLMVEDHKEDVDLFEKEANNGADAQIKAFAASKVPTLKHHLEMAQAGKDKMK